jgi:hypothetical protein
MDGTPKDSKGGKGSAAEGGSTCKHVDGRNSAPVDIWFIPSLLGFQPSFWWCRISQPTHGDYKPFILWIVAIPKIF